EDDRPAGRDRGRPPDPRRRGAAGPGRGAPRLRPPPRAERPKEQALEGRARGPGHQRSRLCPGIHGYDLRRQRRAWLLVRGRGPARGLRARLARRRPGRAHRARRKVAGREAGRRRSLPQPARGRPARVAPLLTRYFRTVTETSILTVSPLTGSVDATAWKLS